ncbi:hypothetical protein N7468_010107 [Penicillium chermesinum]|uniref:SMP-30/Gluconolactonase/LRE-like region domain-containing protein n=1 Tax=Penicillium chermesinum TaxID=63820 RepID=A0A9W9TC77_9EURO|nr:uncharacterized protein N7468_010107 [Penicillium chermesinum]KAJ5217099.1 hypothetical protein N7468_010107 [Penicillium chermesinum]
MALATLSTCFLLLASVSSAKLPAQAQFIDQRVFNVLNTTLPPSQFNATNVFIPPGSTEDSLTKQPFHVYDKEFLKILGNNPTLTRIARSAKNPLYHEAVVWSNRTNEVFFAQNAGPPAAGTGLNKSAIIEKISLAQVAAVSNRTDASGLVDVITVNATPPVLNANGATNFRGQIVYTSEGQGDHGAPALYLMNPEEPYNTTVLLNNFFGRQFNSLNDIVVHPQNKDIYFTDSLYGYLQDFRPAPGIQLQVYRFNPDTGAVTVAADGFTLPNGFTFSPDGKHAYATDTGINQGFWGYNFSRPASIYRYDVADDGTLENRKTFAFVNSGVPDVWNPHGKLIGKIYLGTTSANFNFVGNGKMVICAETSLYYATLAAGGNYVESEM